MLITWQVVQDAVDAYDAQKGLRRRLKKERAPVMTTIAALLKDRDLKTPMTLQDRFDTTVKLFSEHGEEIVNSRRASAGEARVLVDLLYGGENPFGAYNFLYALLEKNLLTFAVYEKLVTHPYNHCKQIAESLNKCKLLTKENLLMCLKLNDLDKLRQIFISHKDIMQQETLSLITQSQTPSDLADVFSLLSKRQMLTLPLAEKLAALPSPAQSLRVVKKLHHYYPDNAEFLKELQFLFDNQAKIFNEETIPVWHKLPRSAFIKESWEAIKTKGADSIAAFLDELALRNYCRPLFHEQLAKHFTQKFAQSTHGDETQAIREELEALKTHVEEYGTITPACYEQMKAQVYQVFSEHYSQHYPDHASDAFRARIDNYCLSTKLKADILVKLNFFAKGHTPPEPPPSPKQPPSKRDTKWYRMSRVRST